MGESTAPALRRLDGQCAANDTHKNKGAAANYDNDAVQLEMADQDDGYLVLDDVDFGEASIIQVSALDVRGPWSMLAMDSPCSGLV